MRRLLCFRPPAVQPSGGRCVLAGAALFLPRWRHRGRWEAAPTQVGLGGVTQMAAALGGGEPDSWCAFDIESL